MVISSLLNQTTVVRYFIPDATSQNVPLRESSRVQMFHTQWDEVTRLDTTGN